MLTAYCKCEILRALSNMLGGFTHRRMRLYLDSVHSSQKHPVEPQHYTGLELPPRDLVNQDSLTVSNLTLHVIVCGLTSLKLSLLKIRTAMINLARLVVRVKQHHTWSLCHICHYSGDQDLTLMNFISLLHKTKRVTRTIWVLVCSCCPISFYVEYQIAQLTNKLTPSQKCGFCNVSCRS